MSNKMKKLLNWIILAWGCIGLIAVHADIASATEDFNRFSAGILASYYNTASSEIGDADANFDTAPVLGVAGAFYINQSFSVEIYTHYLETDLKVEYDDKSGTLGDIKQTPIFLTLRYQHPLDKIKANIYLGLGANYFINTFNQKNMADLSDFFGVNVSADINNSFGWHANVGTEWFFLKNYSAFLDLKVVFNEAEFDLVYPDATQETRDVAINGSALGIGVRYYFF